MDVGICIGAGIGIGIRIGMSGSVAEIEKDCMVEDTYRPLGSVREVSEALEAAKPLAA